MSIRLIVPSRGRPQACVQLAAAFRETIKGHTTTLEFALDNDDPLLGEYQLQLGEIGEIWSVGPRVRMGPTLNREANIAVRCGWSIIGFMGDDHRPRTSGWDLRVEQELGSLDSTLGVAYGDDLVHGQNLPTAAFVSATLIYRLGYMAPPELLHMYLDNFWKLLGEATSLHYMSDVVFEHLHPIAGKAQWSDQYAEVNALMEPDRERYERYLQTEWLQARQRATAL